MGRLTKNIKYAIRKTWFRARGRTRYRQAYYSDTIVAALRGARMSSDISDHLSSIFYYTLEARPRLIVELGTRGGESTRILVSAATMTGGQVLSIDVNDCAGIQIPPSAPWTFLRQDDVAFGREGFVPWCTSRGLPPRADVIYIDTSHLYEHTRDEIAAWTGHLAETGTMIFHDTNMGQGLYGRNDGSIGVGWNNHRGVIRAIEEFLGRRYDERSFFVDVAKGFLIRHEPQCSGLTVLRRIPETLQTA